MFSSPSLPPSLYPYLPLSLPLSLPPSLPFSLPPSLPPSLPLSLLSPSLPPSLSLPLSPSLPPSLPLSPLPSFPQPLNPDPKSGWSKFFADNSVLLQIDHDTRWVYTLLYITICYHMWPALGKGTFQCNYQFRTVRHFRYFGRLLGKTIFLLSTLV